MLLLPPAIYNMLVSRTKDAFPAEVCGILGGSKNIVTHHYPMTVTSCWTGDFAFDPEEQLSVLNDLKRKGASMVAIYHAPQNKRMLPSKIDLNMAPHPDISYVIISLQGEDAIVRSFHIGKDMIAEELIIC